MLLKTRSTHSPGNKSSVKVRKSKSVTTNLTDTPTISFFCRQCETSDLNASISNLRHTSVCSFYCSHLQDLQHMQHTNQPGKTKEPWIGLKQHSLDFIQLSTCSSALLFCGLVEPMSHWSKYLKLHVGHGLKCDLKRHGKRGRVDFIIMRTKVPKLILEHDRFINALSTGWITAIGDEMDI